MYIVRAINKASNTILDPAAISVSTQNLDLWVRKYLGARKWDYTIYEERLDPEDMKYFTLSKVPDVYHIEGRLRIC